MADSKSIEKLNDSNYQNWKYRMELLLIREELLDIVLQSKPEEPTEEWKLKDGKARAFIGLNVDNNQLSHVRKSESAHETWEALRNYHEKASLSNKIHLLKKICSSKLTRNGNMSNHLNEITSLVDRLGALGEDLTEHLVIAMILSSLPDSYDGLITALEGRPEDELRLEFVKGRLLDEWRRRKETAAGPSNVEKAPRTTVVIHKHNAAANRKVICNYCKAEGHVVNNCRKLKGTENKQTNQGKQNESTQKPTPKGSMFVNFFK